MRLFFPREVLNFIGIPVKYRSLGPFKSNSWNPYRVLLLSLKKCKVSSISDGRKVTGQQL